VKAIKLEITQTLKQVKVEGRKIPIKSGKRKRRFLIEKGHNECQKSMLRARVKKKKKEKKR
jgi:hypothetical protein